MRRAESEYAMTPVEITTEGELEALPVRAIVLDAEDSLWRVAKKVPETWDKSKLYNAWDGGGGLYWRGELMPLPATLIWLPEVTA
jgi:hypothetical protein